MPLVSVDVRLQVEVELGANPLEVERAVDAQGKKAARELYCAALMALDGEAVSATGAARQRQEARYIATTFGRVRVWRWRVRERGQPSFHPLDRVLNLSQSEPSAGLREAICEIACRVPYRQVADITTRLTGEEIDHLVCWRVVQAEGRRLIDEEGREVEAIFGSQPELPPEVSSPVGLVVVEADGTYLKGQGRDLPKGQRSFEVKTGVFYTGKHPAGGCRHKRFRLVGKGAYATSLDADSFGKTFATKAINQVGLHRARHVVCVHDGLDEYGPTFRDWFPDAIHQADRHHVNMRVWALAEGDRDRFTELKGQVMSDPLAFALRLPNDSMGLEPDKVLEIAAYLTAVGPHLQGIDRVPRRYRRGRMRVIASSVVEKHQDILVGRRMKKRGMRWTRRGADNLLALQSRRLCNQWPETWGGGCSMKAPAAAEGLRPSFGVDS